MSQKAFVIAENPAGPKWGVTAEIPLPDAPEDKLVVKTYAYAANPTDWKHIDFKEGSPGDITGTDAAGVVEKVGKNVTGFKVGDVVSVFGHGNFSKTRGCFAEYIVASPATTIKYDTTLKHADVGVYRSGTIDTWEGAASVTLGLSTVVLSFAGNLNITSEDKGKYILIWGGATASGILAIQIAKKGYGLKVITTASKKHSDFLKSIGADAVIDYNDSDVIDQIKKAGAGEIRYALDAVATNETWQSLYDATADSSKVTLDGLFFKTEDDLKFDSRSGEVIVAPPTLAYLAENESCTVFGIDWVPDQTALSRYNEFWYGKLPSLIKELHHAKLTVLEPGFESANKAWELLKEGKVSAEKVVWSK